jgi:hypothetical protein
LVLPILVLILFGIVDYGLYFSNSISARSGLQSAARQAAVGHFDACTRPADVASEVSDDVAHLICMAAERTDSISGTTYVKVVLPSDPTDPTRHGWFAGQPLTVCEVVDVAGLTGYVPLPRPNGASGGVIRAKVVTQIEQHDPADEPDDGYQQAGAPGGWDWCT